MTKKNLQKELRDRGIEFDSKANKSVLEALLNDHLKEVIEDNLTIMTDGNVSLGNPCPEAKLEIVTGEDNTFNVDKYAASYKYRGKSKFLGHYATEKDANDALLDIGAKGRVIEHVNK